MKACGKSDATLTAVCGLSVLLSLAGYVYTIVNSDPVAFDDAYMFVRYANNILAGQGHAWNPGEDQTFGSTSLVHVGVVTALKLCLPDMDDGRLLILAAAIPAGLLLLALVAACAGCSRHPFLRGNYLIWGAAVLPALVLQDTFKYHLRSGMDTMLSTLANTLLILFTFHFIRRASNRRMLLVVIFAYLSWLARPDNGIYATLFPVLCVLVIGTENRRRWLLVFSVCMVAVLSCDLIAKRLVFGTAMPLPFYAKQHGAYEGYAGYGFWNPVVFLRQFAVAAMPFLCLTVFFADKRNARILLALFVPVFLTFGYYFTVNQIMGFQARFYYPSLPFVVVAAAVVVDERFRRHPDEVTLKPREFVRRLVLTILIILGGRQAAYTLTPVFDKPLGVEPVPTARPAANTAPPVAQAGTQMRDRVADMVAELPQGTVMALSEYGKIGAAAPQVILIDLVGLHEKEVALNGFSADWLFSKKPDLIWFPHEHYTKIIQRILEHPEFQDHYRYYPGGFGLGLAVREQSPRFEEVSSVIRRHWRIVYGDSKMEDYLARPAK